MRVRPALTALGAVTVLGGAVVAPQAVHLLLSGEHGLVAAATVETDVHEQLKARNGVWADALTCTAISPASPEGRCTVTDDEAVTPLVVTLQEDGSLELDVEPTDDLQLAN